MSRTEQIAKIKKTWLAQIEASEEIGISVEDIREMAMAGTAAYSMKLYDLKRAARLKGFPASEVYTRAAADERREQGRS
jgi:hypothetical protein